MAPTKTTRMDLVAIAISVVGMLISIAAVAFSRLQWLETRALRLSETDVSISFDVDADPSDRNLGVALRNVGPGVAHIQSVKYYVDRKLVGDVAEAIESAKLDSSRYYETEFTDNVMAAGQVTTLVNYKTRGDEDANRAADFFGEHLDIGVEYCSADRRCHTDCSTPGACGEIKATTPH
jgi:hypothetical protein